MAQKRFCWRELHYRPCSHLAEVLEFVEGFELVEGLKLEKKRNERMRREKNCEQS